MQNNRVFLRKVVKTIWQKILSNSLALTSKNVWTVLIPEVRNLETKATVGPLLAILFGKYLNMAMFQVLSS